ncbi:PREDICTED: protocadherin beta-15-like [Ficedula albicollis]|uniref:protocadherin beta-15-like n=1 Tax=Ficedula albicollis TaxID=59894 RepID=UPI0007AD8DA3|nr:PREDICTED: protocadherin beta-15-like [Ficedula albicollis]
MCAAGRSWGRRQRALLWVILLMAWEAAWGQLRYSVPEEMPKGSFVGDVAKDLGLQLPEIRDRGVHVLDKGRKQYFALHGKTGHLVTAERIDREQLCESVQQCMLGCELIVEGQMEVYGIQVEITDINDNAPSFRDTETVMKIIETAAPGSRFPLPDAHDPDSGRNSLQSYELSDDEHFSLAVQAGPGGDQRPELVLAKALDREEAAFHELVLRAMDGGDPARTGTARIRVKVLDANDNAPVFSQAEYTVRVPEDVPVGSVLVTVTATDADEGLNGEITYSLKKVSDRTSDIFHLDSECGSITLLRSLDYEEGDSYELQVQARDGGGLSDTAKVTIFVTDINDNAPEISVRSALNEISEDAPMGTVVALLHVQDRDSGPNGAVGCSLDGDIPFRLEKSFDDYYRILVTVSALDRERTARYVLGVTAADAGSPPLTSTHTFTVDISDVNDNAPVFNQTSYTMYVRENNAPTVFVGAVSAADADVGLNAKVTYSLAPVPAAERPSCSCISVNSENGHVFVLRPLDYERLRQSEVTVSASDAGSPPLRANVTVRLVVLDENDNAPLVLYPAQDGSAASSELVPVSAEPGYLVTKVVAVDADSGQNSWLSYHLLRATEPGLFSVAVQSGEVRLKRPVTERDSAKHKLLVLVRDNGKPPLSATAALSALLLKDFSDVRLPHGSPPTDEQGDSLTTYLIIALVFVSLLFLISSALFVARKVCKSKELKAAHVLSGAHNLHSGLADAAAAGTLPRAYCYEISLTTGSGNSEFQFLKPILPSLPAQHCATGQGPQEQEQDFPCVPVSTEDMAPDNAGTLSARQFNEFPVGIKDADVGLNAKVTYSLAPVPAAERPSCSCISVNSENGHVFVLRPLDYERLRQSEVTVSASDAGSPPLRANVTVRLVVLDENDNAPLVLYPAQDGSAASSELVPVSAEPGYLVTKVVAVDADSGQNSWLSYHLLRATEPGLFSVAVQSGEVRLKRPVTERDSAKHKLLVLVRDNGKPPLSATAALSALLLKDFSDVRLPHGSPPTDEQGDSLTTYLIIALVFVSLLFLISSALFVARKVCKSKELKAAHVLSGAHNLHSGLADAAAAGTLPRAYCYEISLTTGSGNSEFQFLKPILPSLPAQHCATGQGPQEQEQDFSCVPVSTEDVAPDNAGTLSARQFNALSLN